MKEWNLSPEVVQSRRAKQAYHRYLATDETFRTEITNKIGDIDHLPGFGPETNDNGAEDVDYDDTSVPLHEVIQDVMGMSVSDLAGEEDSNVAATLEHASDRYTSCGGVENDGGFLRPSHEIESVWTFDANGERWGHDSYY